MYLKIMTTTILMGLAVLPLLASGQERVDIDHGFNVEFFAEPLSSGTELQAGVELSAGFRISDRRSGKGIPDLHPAGWMLRRDKGAGPPDAAACEKLVRKQARGSLSQPVDADLNSFQILTLNADHSIGFINPQVNLNSANLMAIVPLESPVAQWHIDEVSGNAFLTLPERDELVVVDLETRQLSKRIPVGDQPQTLAQQPDGRYLWVGNHASGTLSVVDSVRHEVLSELTVGAGPIELAFDGRSRYAFVAAGGRLQRVDAQSLQVVDRMKIDDGDWLLDYSNLADAVYLVERDAGKLLVLRPDNLKEVVEIDLGETVSLARITPDGRHLLVLHPTSNSLSVVDTANNRRIRRLPTGHHPDRITFNQSYAYVRNRDSADVTLLQLAGLEDEGTLPVVQIGIGSEGPGVDRAGPDLGAVASLPEGGGAMIANPADRTIYYYMEGMLAPSNTLKTYTAPPLSIWLYDRSLQEQSEQGRYATTLNLEKPGVYDVPFYLPSPQMILCFEVEVGGADGVPQQVSQLRPPPRMQSLFDGLEYKAGEPVELRFKINSGSSGSAIEGIGDGMLLSFKRKSHWQQRTRVEALGGGVYRAVIRYPSAGEYYLLFRSPSLGVEFGEVEHLKVQIGPADNAYLSAATIDKVEHQ